MGIFVALPYFNISSPARKWVFFSKFVKKIVKIHRNKSYLKSIAEISSIDLNRREICN